MDTVHSDLRGTRVPCPPCNAAGRRPHTWAWNIHPDGRATCVVCGHTTRKPVPALAEHPRHTRRLRRWIGRGKTAEQRLALLNQANSQE